MDERVITYRIGAETNPTSMLLALAAVHGVEAEVSEALDSLPEGAHFGEVEYLGPLLRKHRQARGMTRKEVHARSNISLSQISFYESEGNIKNPGLRTLQALAYGYRIDFVRIMIAALREINPRMSVRKRPRDNL